MREEDGEKTYEWDYLVFANGASPPQIPPAIEGIDLPGVFTADLPPDAVAITEYLEKNPPVENVVVIGTGYIAIEMAEAFVERGARTLPSSEGAKEFSGRPSTRR